MALRHTLTRLTLLFFVLASFTGVARAEEENAFAKGFWSSYETSFIKECVGESDPTTEQVMPAICACAFKKIKANHSITDLMGNKVSEATYEAYGAQCAEEVMSGPGAYPEGVRNTIVTTCAEGAPELGEQAVPYCSCFVDKLEAEFTFAQVMADEVTDADYDRLGGICVSEVFGEDAGEGGE